MTIRKLWQYPALARPVSQDPETVYLGAWQQPQSQPLRNQALRRLTVAALVAIAPTFFFVGEPTAAASGPEPLNQEAQLRAVTASAAHFAPAFFFVEAPTRFYLPSTGAAAVSPAFAAWNDTAQAGSRRCVTTKTGSAMAPVAISDAVDPAGTTFLWRQYVSDPIAAQTVTGTVKAQLRVNHASGFAHHDRVRLCIKIVSGDGTVLRGTLLPLGAYTTANEYALALTNRKAADGDALSPVVAQAGDRIVVELGTGATVIADDPDEILVSFGDDSGTDLAEDETATATNNPWIEFSGTIAFVQQNTLLEPLNQETRIVRRAYNRPDLQPNFFFQEQPAPAAFTDQPFDAVSQPRGSPRSHAYRAPSFFFQLSQEQAIDAGQPHNAVSQPRFNTQPRAHLTQSFFFQEDPVVAFTDQPLDATSQPQGRHASRRHLAPTFFFQEQPTAVAFTDQPFDAVTQPRRPLRSQHAALAGGFSFSTAPTAITLYTVTYPGIYRVNAYVVMTSVTSGGTVEIKTSWTDSYQLQADKVLLTLAYTAAGDFDGNSKLLYAASGPITFTATFSGTASYNLYIDVEVA